VRFQFSIFKYQISTWTGVNASGPALDPQSQIRNQESKIRNGYTLTELLVVLALLSLATGVLAMTIYQFYAVTNWGNAQMAVDADLRNAGQWLEHDGNQSISFTPGGGCGVFAAPAYTGSISTTRYIAYVYSSPTLNRQDSSAPGQTISVARRIATPPLCTVQGRMVIVNLTSKVGNVSNIATFTVTLRVN
jgi:prepilin-type N-terminal cleavage/methylation domain-containing protein